MIARVGPLCKPGRKPNGIGRSDITGARKSQPVRGEKTRGRINSRQKGAAGEREFAHFLQDHKLSARRGQQFHGGADSPDVICEDLTEVHFEVKRVEKFNIHASLKQAIKDAGSRLPIVAHRRSKEDWLAVVRMADLIPLLKLREGNIF